MAGDLYCTECGIKLDQFNQQPHQPQKAESDLPDALPEPHKAHRVSSRKFIWLVILLAILAGGYMLIAKGHFKLTDIVRLKEAIKDKTLTTGSKPNITEPMDSVAPALEYDSFTEEGNIIFSNRNKILPIINNAAVGTPLFLLSKSARITKITTYHYNYGKGDARGGEITLKGGVTYGPFKCKEILPGDDDTPNVKWVFEPDVLIKPGKYQVELSVKNTWSYNVDSDGKGFVEIEGYYSRK